LNRKGDNTMTDNMKYFLEEASKNSEISKRIIALNETITDKEENKAALIALASENGIVLDSNDFEEDLGCNIEEISDEELESVAGGKTVRDSVWSKYHSDCQCPVGGSGSADKYQKKCVCVLAGAGELTDEGKKAVKNGTYRLVGSSGSPVAMYCPLIGTAFG